MTVYDLWEANKVRFGPVTSFNRYIWDVRGLVLQNRATFRRQNSGDKGPQKDPNVLKMHIVLE